jgi:biopolymer transport protein ExbD
MRFPRQAKIFRGQLDPAPLAGVFFLLIIFLLLRTLIYTPGVLVRTGAGQSVAVARDGIVRYAGKSYKAAEMDQLRSDLRSSSQPLVLRSEPGAPPSVIAKVNDLLRIEPPTAELAGTDNPTVVVAVNLRGQFFFDNQIVEEKKLREELTKELNAAANKKKDLTLVLLADKGVEYQVIVRLSSLATEVGIKEVLWATRKK